MGDRASVGLTSDLLDILYRGVQYRRLAVVWGAERFYTHNTKDFGPHITEIEVVVPGT